MTTTIFYDIETRTWAEDHILGWEEIDSFGLAVAVTMCECHGCIHWIGPEEAEALYRHLTAHDRVVGFNILRFDNTIVSHDAVQSREALDEKTFDILVDLADRLGHRVKLEQVAQATLERGKLGDGAKAVAWWKAYEALKDYEPAEAEMYLSRIKAYCQADVEIERDIYQFGRANGYVKYVSRGETKIVEVDWRQL